MLNWLWMRAIFIFFAIAALLALSACDSTSDSPGLTQGCPAGAAMIAVTDGYLETLCGCAEAAPAYFAPGSRLTCTVTAGTTVFFNYFDTHTMHKIVPVGTPAIPPSALSNPNDPSTMIYPHVVKLSD